MNEVESNSMVASQRQYSMQESFLPESSATAPNYQTLSGLFRVLRQRWKTMAVTALIVGILATVACLLLMSYSATTIIEINKDDPSDNDAAQMNGAALTADDIKNEVQTDVSILQTDDTLALDVIKKLNLIEDPSFKKAVDPSEKGKSLDDAPRTREKIIDSFHHKLKIDSPPDTRLITITFKSSDPVLAANVTNTLARTFIDDTLSRRQRSIEQSSGWLQHELADLKKQVQDSEQRLTDYERTAGLSGIQLTGAANGNGTTNVSVSPENTVTARLFALNQELDAAEANRISTGAVYDLVKNKDPEAVLGLGPMSVSNGNGGGAGAVTPEGIQTVSTLRAQQSDLERQVAAADVKYGTSNPRRIQLQQQLDAVKSQLQAELERIRSRAESNFLYAKKNEDTIRAQFARQEGASDVLADKSVKLQLLAQEAFSNRALYEGLFSKLQTATLASGTRATRIGIVAEAIPAGSPSTKLGIILAIVLAAMLFFSVSAAFLRESLDETVRSPQDLSEVRGLTMLGYIPRLPALLSSRTEPGSSELVDAPRSPFSEAFRALRTSINIADVRWGSPTVSGPDLAATMAAAGVPVFTFNDDSPVLSGHSPKPKIILVTSGLGGAGKTTVTYNLGVAFAQQGARVLLIDGDLRNPDLNRLFNTPVAPGLSEACAHPGSPEVLGVVQHSILPSLFILPAGELPELPSELFASPAFDSVLQKVSSRYDYVLIDSPPILAVTDASIIATKVNSIVAVVRSRNTTRPVLAALVQAMHRTNAPSLRFVLNDVRNPILDGFHDYSYSRVQGGQNAAAKA